MAVEQAAFGTDNYAAQCLLCTAILKEEFSCCVSAVKQRLCRLRSGSKQFWSLSKKILLGADTTSAIRASKGSDGSWVRLAGEKANLFAASFQEK